jgi:hypothetical protein
LLYGFQLILVIVLIIAELNDRGVFDRPTDFSATVVRGNPSWEMLSFSFGLIAVNVLQIINSADDTVKFKVLMSGFDLAVLIRLFFFNGWFRNKTISLVSQAKGLEEGRRAMPKPPAPASGGENA